MKRKAVQIAVALGWTLGSFGLALANDLAKETAAQRAERFLRAVYCCEQSDLAVMSSDEVCISYPIFEEILGKSAIRGRAAVEAFSERFCSRWSDPVLNIHETVSEGNEVLLLWSFQATSTAGTDPESRKWGGMSYFRFDAEGRVTLELGEESTPGPWARLNADAQD